MPPLRVLIVATKPPWPPVGGGNLAVHNMVCALHRRGVEVAVAALNRRSPGEAGTPPYPLHHLPWSPPPLWRSAHHLLLPPPVLLARYRSSRLQQMVEAEVRRFEPSVIHLEQLHLAWLARQLRAHAPVVLRQQNVESVILQRLARAMGDVRGLLLAREARRMARAEAAGCNAVTAVAAISEPDARRMRALAPEALIEVIPPAFPVEEMPQTPSPHLAGEPPLICIASFDWPPTRDGGRWLLNHVWPRIRELLPGAVLHLAGPGSDELLGGTRSDAISHGVVQDPRQLYDQKGVVLVPLRAGSGVRLRILEAWVAGVPVVTTAIGGEGLISADGEGALIADTPEAIARATARATGDPQLRRRMVSRGRDLLSAHHPDVVAGRLIDLYRRVGAA